jgi:hypothetical protein
MDFNNLNLAQSLGLLTTGAGLLEGQQFGEAVRGGVGTFSALDQLEQERKRREMLAQLLAVQANANPTVAPTVAPSATAMNAAMQAQFAQGLPGPRVDTLQMAQQATPAPAMAPVAPASVSAPMMPASARPSLTPQQRQLIAAMPSTQGLQTAATLLGKTYSGAPVQIEFQGRRLSFNADDPQLVRYLNAGAVQLDKGVNPVLKSQFEQEEKLSRQYTGELDVKNYKGIRDAYDRLNSAFTIQTNTPEARAQADLSMVIAYMKMLDPGSVVREGEQEMARQTAGISDQLFNTYQKVKTGEFLTQQQRAGFMLNAQQIRQDVEGNLVSTNTSYRDRANRYGVNPSFILSPKEYEEIGIPDMTPPPERWLSKKPPEIDPNTWAETWLKLPPEKRKLFEQ